MIDVLHHEALRLLGVPFLEDGRNYEPCVGGADCLGIVLEFRRRIGARVEAGWTRLRETWCGNAETSMPRDFARVSPGSQLEVGDVGVTIDAQHVVAYAGGGWVLHSQRAAGSTLSELRRVAVGSWWRCP